MLPLDIDPKLAWALKFRDSFPVDVNRAPKEMLLRVPGLGTKAVERILCVAALAQAAARRRRATDACRSPRCARSSSRCDWRPTLLTDRADLRTLVAPKEQQLELFAA